jgi:hypothetical protein
VSAVSQKRPICPVHLTTNDKIPGQTNLSRKQALSTWGRMGRMLTADCMLQAPGLFVVNRQAAKPDPQEIFLGVNSFKEATACLSKCKALYTFYENLSCFEAIDLFY